MRLFGVHLRAPGEDELGRLLREAEQSALTYDHVGSTLAEAGRGSERRGQVELGAGPEVFDRAVEALRLWRPQRGIGAVVRPEDAPIEVGSTLLVVLRFGPFAVVVPDRVVAVVDEPDRFGFAYGTLAGHAERGEESFLIERAPDGTVTATIRVDATPATLPARLAHPAVMAIQRRALRGYLQAIIDHVANPTR